MVPSAELGDLALHIGAVVGHGALHLLPRRIATRVLVPTPMHHMQIKEVSMGGLSCSSKVSPYSLTQELLNLGHIFVNVLEGLGLGLAKFSHDQQETPHHN